MVAALGPYPMQREASGTAWQPDNSEHQGLMTSSGDWTLMAHGVLNLVYDHQSGERGDDQERDGRRDEDGAWKQAERERFQGA